MYSKKATLVQQQLPCFSLLRALFFPSSHRGMAPGWEPFFLPFLSRSELAKRNRNIDTRHAQTFVPMANSEKAVFSASLSRFLLRKELQKSIPSSVFEIGMTAQARKEKSAVQLVSQRETRGMRRRFFPFPSMERDLPRIRACISAFECDQLHRKRRQNTKTRFFFASALPLHFSTLRHVTGHGEKGILLATLSHSTLPARTYEF